MLEIRKQISCPSYAARTQWNEGGGGGYKCDEQEHRTGKGISLRGAGSLETECAPAQEIGLN